MKAVNVLLVDDEAVDLEWLKRRVEQSGLSVRVAGTARSGFDALKRLEEMPVDIILSDIRMPIMSGIEFARKAKKKHPAVQIAFISGHEDFRYAREAIQLNAFDYLLKPVEDQALHAMLSSLCAKVEREKEQHRALSETLSLVNRELLLRYLREQAPAPAEPHIRSLLEPRMQRGMAVALCEIDDWEWKSAAMREEERQRTKQRLDRFLEREAKAWQGILLDLPPNRYAILADWPRETSAASLQKLIDAVREQFPLTFTVGLGKFVHRLEQLPESFREAKAALNLKWLLGKDRLIRGESLTFADSSFAADADVEKVCGELVEALFHYDLVAIDDGLRALFPAHAAGANKPEVYDRVVRITSRLHADLLGQGENLYELLKWDAQHPAPLFRFETMHDVVSWLRRRFFELSELLYAKRRRQKRKLIEAVMKAVEEEIEHKPTLKRMADRFQFSPNYLGYLFKEETGMHFSDYVSEVRMRRVCRLLLDPTLKIYEIAERCGYKNIIYFNRQFKQHTGLTPGQYRKRHKV